MKITKKQLRLIIREALELNEKKKKGLWDNVHAKRKRGEKPAKKGDKDYPDEKAWKSAQESDCDETEDVIEEILDFIQEQDKDRMKCNKPRYIKDGETGHGDKQKVVKACEDGKEKIVRFGDAKMRNNSDKKKNKKNFRSRHNCDQKKDKMKAGYWACKDW